MSKVTIVSVERFKNIFPNLRRYQKLVLCSPVIHKPYCVNICGYPEFKFFKKIIMYPLKKIPMVAVKIKKIHHGIFCTSEELIAFPGSGEIKITFERRLWILLNQCAGTNNKFV